NSITICVGMNVFTVRFVNEPPRYCRRLQLSLSLFVTQSHTSVMIVKALFDRLARALLSA
ncbi:hypothetical protein, partial [Psychrobacter sp. FME13]|uniref:hypothetical protein n=1 Tax=Psychrobacter sp. FME13 TaxID=2487708 RepID=UPI001CE3EABF